MPYANLEPVPFKMQRIVRKEQEVRIRSLGQSPSLVNDGKNEFLMLMYKSNGTLFFLDLDKRSGSVEWRSAVDHKTFDEVRQYDHYPKPGSERDLTDDEVLLEPFLTEFPAIGENLFLLPRCGYSAAWQEFVRRLPAPSPSCRDPAPAEVASNCPHRDYELGVPRCEFTADIAQSGDDGPGDADGEYDDDSGDSSARGCGDAPPLRYTDGAASRVGPGVWCASGCPPV